jgi:ABC-type transport system involved in multi-copper enzyme maturation permease subunit
MTFLPIVSRELRLASRRRGTYWLRSGAALAIMAVGSWLFLILKGEAPKDLAIALFSVLTGGAVLVALLTGPHSTADCISEEKREGTLGLLFLTDLKGYDVVIGKLVAGSLNAFYTVVAILPMMAIPLLLGGGITFAEVGRMILVIIDALFFSLTIAICVSALTRSAQKSASLSVVMILFFGAILPGCGALLASIHKTDPVNPWFMTPSPGFSYYLSFDGPFKAKGVWYWTSLAVIHGLSWLSLIIASLIAPASWQDRPLTKNAMHWQQAWLAWKFGRGTNKFALRCRLLEVNPIFWLMARVRSKMVPLWFFLALLTAAWLWGWWRLRREWLNEGICIITALILNLTLRYWFAGEATRAFAENRKSGALELLLSTPLKIEELLRGQWLALKQQLFAPVILVLAIECLFMLRTAREAFSDDDRVFWFVFWCSGMLMLVADLLALYWVGMWQGLTARNQLRAAAGSLARILVAPWIAYGAILLLLLLTEMAPRAYRTPFTWKFFLGLWFGLGIGVDFLFGLWAKQKLITEIRLVAQEPYGRRTDFWKSLVGDFKPQNPSVESSGYGTEPRPHADSVKDAKVAVRQGIGISCAGSEVCSNSGRRYDHER